MPPPQIPPAIRQLAEELKRLNAKSDGKPDWWSRASVISTFLSSVVIALVGLAISSSIQKAQLLSSEQSAKAQLEAVRLKDESDERIQQSKLEADLFEHLFSNDALHRALALNMLHRAVPLDFYEQTVLMFAVKDSDPGVSSAAIKQLSVSTDPNVLRIILQIANDPARPPSVRAEAALASKSLAFTTAIEGTVVMYAGRVSERAGDRNTGSLFTFALSEALDDTKMSAPSGGIDLQRVTDYILHRVPILTDGLQNPQLQVTGYHALEPIFQPGSKVTAIVLAISQYRNPQLASLKFPEADAVKLAESLRRKGAQVVLVTGEDATREAALSAISKLKGMTDDNSDLIFYFGGSAWSDNDGKAYFATFDSDFADKRSASSTALSAQEIMSALNLVRGRRRILLLDAYRDQVITR